MKENKVLFVDNLRAIATIFVMLWHLGCMFWFSSASVASLLHIEEKSGIIQTVPKIYADIVNVVFQLKLDFGMLGVAIFFLISGFIIPYSVGLRRGNKGTFLLKRLLRIQPVYALGFGVTFLCIQFFGKAVNGYWLLSLKDYVIQASLLRDWFWVPSIDAISWTLEIEIKFYVLFFILFVLKCEDNPKVISGIAIIIMVLSILNNANAGKLLELGRNYFIFSNVIVNSLIYIIFVFMGLALYQLYVGKWNLKVWIAVEEILIACFLVAVYYGSAENIGDKFLVNYGIALLLFLNGYALRNTVKQGKILKFFAQNSFAIYLLHGLNGYILLTVFYDLGLPMYINLPLTIGIILLVAWLFQKYIEKPIQRLMQKIIFERLTAGQDK